MLFRDMGVRQSKDLSYAWVSIHGSPEIELFPCAPKVKMIITKPGINNKKEWQFLDSWLETRDVDGGQRVIM